jgi:hypothetical protein
VLTHGHRFDELRLALRRVLKAVVLNVDRGDITGRGRRIGGGGQAGVGGTARPRAKA